MTKNIAANRIKLGIFVTVGTLLFIASIYFLGRQQNLFGSNIHVSGIFKNIGGLQEGSSVQFTGINVGTVKKIELITDTTVRVDMVIEKKVIKFIKQDAIAEVGSDGLMGNKIVSIFPGSPTSQPIADFGVLQTRSAVSTDDLMKNLKKITDNADGITKDLASVFHKINNGEGTIGTLISDKTLANNIKSAVSNMNEGTKGLKGGVAAITNGMTSIEKDLSDVTGKIKRGEGPLGMMLTDTALSRNIKESVNNIKEGTAGFSQNMEALKHSIFLKGAYKQEEKEKLKKQYDLPDSFFINGAK
jgi:phospholipid/cholesterol/gamma-HCH transport system substrate-binding protein